ncbi:scarecrow-like protein 18 [Macadamia integrifolia]|uniref:scarecrow-like protein 18 n=1 Tax=Macadamia integrifolia TaxID=60698 RepID=UPI001C4FF4E3|nr:scarecrow-like protein 18 [Macadamia integrifolia]
MSEMLSSMGTSLNEEEEEDPLSDPNYLQNQIPLVSRRNFTSPATHNIRQLLIRCAELVSTHSDVTAAQRLVSLISSNASPYGDSTERLVHQFARALSFRLNQHHLLSHPLGGGNLLRLSRTTTTTNVASISSTTATPTSLLHQDQMTTGSGGGGFWVSGASGGGGGSGGASAAAANQDLDSEAVESSYLYLNQITPFIRFSHLTANQAILEATEGQDCIHILDFDTKQGLQWPPLMQAIAERHLVRSSSTSSPPKEKEEENSESEEPSESNPSPTPTTSSIPPMIRITGTGQDLSTLRRTGDRLQKFAHSLGLRFQFCPLLIEEEEGLPSSQSPSWVGAAMATGHLPSAVVPLMPNEALAVNCVHFLHRLLRDNDDDARLFLRAIRAMNPKVVTVAEREAGHNQPYLQRFVQALDHYTAIFDSLEATLPPNSRERLTVEQVWFGKEILDLVAAAEGGDQGRQQRHERTFKTWVELLRASGFSGLPLSPFALSQAKLLLRLHYPSEGYQLQILNDSIFLGWQDQPLFSVSSWH